MTENIIESCSKCKKCGGKLQLVREDGKNFRYFCENCDKDEIERATGE